MKKLWLPYDGHDVPEDQKNCGNCYNSLRYKNRRLEFPHRACLAITMVQNGKDVVESTCSGKISRYKRGVIFPTDKQLSKMSIIQRNKFEKLMKGEN